MKKLSKRISAIGDKVEQTKSYSVLDAVNLLKEVSSVKFDESVVNEEEVVLITI